MIILERQEYLNTEHLYAELFGRSTVDYEYTDKAPQIRLNRKTFSNLTELLEAVKLGGLFRGQASYITLNKIPLAKKPRNRPQRKWEVLDEVDRKERGERPQDQPPTDDLERLVDRLLASRTVSETAGTV